jgi:hypothetical protein
VSSLFGNKVTAAAAIKAATSGADRKVDGLISKNSNKRHHHARVQSGKGAGEMPLAATVKSQMLRLLRRSKSTRGPQGGSAARGSRKKGDGDASTVIPNTRFSVLVDSPSATRRMVTIVDPYTMTLGAAGVATAASSSGAKHAVTTKRQTSNKESCRSSSRARRLKTQVLTMVQVVISVGTDHCLWMYRAGFPDPFSVDVPHGTPWFVSDMPRTRWSRSATSRRYVAGNCFYLKLRLFSAHSAIGLQIRFAHAPKKCNIVVREVFTYCQRILHPWWQIL